MNSNLSMRRVAGNPVRCSILTVVLLCALVGVFSTSPSEDADEPILRSARLAPDGDRRMSPASWCYSPAPSLDSAGTSPCRASICATAQCLEIFLNGAILFFGGGLDRRATYWPQEEERGELAAPCRSSSRRPRMRRSFAMPTRAGNAARIQRPQRALALAGHGADEARRHRGRHRRGQVHLP